MSKLGTIIFILISLVFVVSCVSKEMPATETYYENGYRTEYKTETYTTTEDVVVKTFEGSTLLNAKSQWQTSWVYLTRSGVYSMFYYGYDISTQEHTRGQVQISFKIDPQLNKGAIEIIDLTDACSDENIPNASWVFGKECTQATTMFIPAEGCQFLSPYSIGRGDPKTWVVNFNALVSEPSRLIRNVSIVGSEGDKISFDAKGIKEFAIFASVEPQLIPPNVKLIWSDDVIEKKTVTKERQVSYQVPVQVEKQRTVTKIEKVPIWEVWKANPPATTESSSQSTTDVKPKVEQTSPSIITNEPSQLVPSNKPIYSDDFSNPNSGWRQESSEEGESYYKEGEFHGIVNKWDWAGWQYNRNAGRFNDFIIEEDIRLVSGPKNSGYGLIFRCQDDDNFYRFLVAADGSYLLGTKLEGKWTELQRWTRSEYVEKGYSSNHFKVVCRGPKIEVYANGHHLTTIIDNSFADGYIGGIIDSSEPGAHIAFDNLEVYKID